jgi:hypothetical protein
LLTIRIFNVIRQLFIFNLRYKKICLMLQSENSLEQMLIVQLHHHHAHTGPQPGDHDLV